MTATAGAAAAEPSGNAVSAEDALDAFFRDLDRKSTTLAPGDDRSIDSPAFPTRAALQERFTARLVRVDRLRAKAIAGETYRGFLEARGFPMEVDLSIISEENGDRLDLYRAIAAQTNGRIDDVGRLRADKVGVMCKRGVWVQDAKGKWAQKTR